MNIHIENLIIEVTRKCNFSCQHCLRGDAENISIDFRYVENIFKHIDSIGLLTFTGGEPQLAVCEISQILKLAKYHKVDVGNFYVATNGSIDSNDFVLVMMEWYIFCSYKSLSRIEISMDYYHQLEKNVNIDSLLLSTLKFCNTRDIDRKYDNDFSSQGRWKGKSKTSVMPEPLLIEYTHDDIKHVSILGELYINAKGFLVEGCDFSYEEQEDNICGCVINSWLMRNDETNEFIPINDWINIKIEK